MLISQLWSASTLGLLFAAKPGNPAVDNVCGTPTSIIRVDKNSIDRAILCAGSALHTPVQINYPCLVIDNPEDAVRTNILTVAAAYTQLFR